MCAKIRKLVIAATSLVLFLTVSPGKAEDNLSGRELLRAVRDSSPTHGEKLPTVTELLDKYAETQDKLKSFVITNETTMKGATNHPITPSALKGKIRYSVSSSEFCYDGNRMSTRLHRWLNLTSLPDKPLSKGHSSYNYNRYLWDGKFAWSYTAGAGDHIGRVSINTGPDAKKELTIALSYEADMMGYFSGDSERIDRILRQSNGVSVRPQTERVGEWECYVIDADTKHGRYTLWIDPAHGYNVAGADVQKKESDLAYGKRMEAGMHGSSCYRVVRFGQAEGVWLPMEMELHGELKWGGGFFSRGKSHVKRTSVTLSPDRDALGSFVVDDVPNGAQVRIVGVESKYTWQDGQVVNEKGNKVDLHKVRAESQKSRVKRPK